MNYKINHIFLFIISISIIGCPSAPEEENIRFKPLKEPIEGTLLFVAGPDLEELDSLQNHYPWDFYQLKGKQFTKLNDESFFLEGDDGRWNYQWSPNGNYFSYYHDKGPFDENTDDIGVINRDSFNEVYLTDLLGDANTFDGAQYQWAIDDSYIYFSAIPLGQTEYDENISPDIYRAKPDGSKLEQITNNDFYEAHATTTLDGDKLFYEIYPDSNYPDSLWGFYSYDFSTKTHKQIVNNDKWEGFTGHSFFPPMGHMNVLLNKHPDGKNIIFENETIINIDTGELQIFEIGELNRDAILIPIPGSEEKVVMYEGWWEDWNIYIFDLNTGMTTNLTKYLRTADGKFCRFGKPTISPSGEYIAFTAQIDYDYSDWNGFGDNLVRQKTEIYLMNLETEEVTRLTGGLFGWEGYLKWIE